MQNIFYDRKKGVIAILIIFVLAFGALITVPKIISNIFSSIDKRARSTIQVNLSQEEQDKFQKEIRDLEASLTIDPAPQGESLARAHRDIASRYANMGRLGDAIAHYDKALDAQRTDTAAYVEKGKTLGRIGELVEGEESIKKAIELEPTQATHYSNLAQYYSDFGKDNENARGTYIEGLVRTNNNANLMREFASFLELIGETSEAYLYWVELGKKFPADQIIKERIKALQPQKAQ